MSDNRKETLPMDIAIGAFSVQEKEINRLRGEVARLTKDRDETCWLLADEIKRNDKLEAGLRDALIDCEFSMEPKLHSDLKALLGGRGE